MVRIRPGWLIIALILFLFEFIANPMIVTAVVGEQIFIEDLMIYSTFINAMVWVGNVTYLLIGVCLALSFKKGVRK